MENSSPNLLIRVLWFILVGWWLSGIWSLLSWFAAVTIIGLPLAIWMLNRIPQVATLKLDRRVTTLDDDVLAVHSISQRSFLQRALYFLLIGWWFSGVWVTIAWVAGVSVVGIPLAFWMYGAAGKVLTLKR